MVGGVGRWTALLRSTAARKIKIKKRRVSGHGGFSKQPNGRVARGSGKKLSRQSCASVAPRGGGGGEGIRRSRRKPDRGNGGGRGDVRSKRETAVDRGSRGTADRAAIGTRPTIVW